MKENEYTKEEQEKKAAAQAVIDEYDDEDDEYEEIDELSSLTGKMKEEMDILEENLEKIRKILQENN